MKHVKLVKQESYELCIEGNLEFTTQIGILWTKEPPKKIMSKTSKPTLLQKLYPRPNI